MTDIEARRLDLYNVLQEMLGQFAGFRAEFVDFKIEMHEFKIEMREAIREINKRIDRVFLAMVAGQFV